MSRLYKCPCCAVLALGALAYAVAAYSAAFRNGAFLGLLFFWLALIERDSPSILLRRTLRVAALIAAGSFVILTALNAPIYKGDMNWIQTLNAHVGPALRARSGGVPLVDVFCQYGFLPYLIFAAAFSTVLAPSYASGALVVSIVAALYLLAVIVILCRYVKSWFLALIAAALAAVLLIPAWQGIPGSGGLRFLPPLLIAAGVAAHPREKHLSLYSLAPLLLSAFWSAEALAWGFLVFALGMGARLFHERAKFRAWVYCIGGTALAIVAAHVLFSLGTYLAFGSWPRYGIYADIILGYRGQGWAGVPFTTPILPLLAETLAYVSVIWFAGAAIRRTDKPIALYVLLPFALAGLLEMSYWAARPLAFNLYPTMIPAVIILAVAVDLALDRGGIVRAGTAVIVFLLFGIAGVHFRFNFSDAETFFSPEHVQALRSTPQGAEWYDVTAWEAAELARKYQQGAGELLLFLSDSRDIPVFLLTGARDALGRSSANDEMSGKLRLEMMHRAQSIRPEFIYLSRYFLEVERGRPPELPPDYVSPVSVDLYRVISRGLTLCILAESPGGVIAAVTRPKAAGCPPGLAALGPSRLAK